MLPSPADLGAPARLTSLRPQQEIAIEWAMGQSKRFLCGVLPTGTGKSIYGWYLRQLQGQPGAFLTATKGLAQQYADKEVGLALPEIRGMGTYPCRALGNALKCDAGPCLDGEACPWRSGGCSYYDAEAAARESEQLVTTYAYWFSHPDPATLDPRPILICDEAHDIPAVLAAAVGVEFHGREINLRESGMDGWELDDWQSWASEKARQCLVAMKRKAELGARELRDLRALYVKLHRLATANTQDWAFEMNETSRDVHIRFEPIDPGPYAEKWLYRGARQVILLSATLTQAQLPEMGIGKDDFSWLELDSPFPLQRRPLWWWETGIRLSGKTSQINLELWASKLDQLIAQRLRNKGIIHTVSYARAKFIEKYSRFAQHMIIHDSEDTRASVERFKRAQPPCILVSPAVDQGWDFPFDAARWQIIGKVPYPDTRRGISAARAARDRQHIFKVAAGKLSQMYGRIVRDTTDWGETIVADDAMGHLFSHFRPYFTKSFRMAFRSTAVPPPVLQL